MTMKTIFRTNILANSKRFQSTMAEVYRLHHAPTTPITLKSLISRGPSPPLESHNWNDWEGENAQKIVESAQMLHREIPIRLASRIVDLEKLPGTLPEHESIVKLRNLLTQSFEEMIRFPKPVDLPTEHAFMKMQLKIRERHGIMHQSIAEALATFPAPSESLTLILDNFYKSRIGLRLLVDHQIAMRRAKPGFIGVIANECSPLQVARTVIKDITPKFKEKYGNVPQIETQGRTDALFKYVPDHLAVIMSELLKVAATNTVQQHGCEDMPPIEVLIAGGSRGVSIKISDQGGGMYWKDVPRLFSYLGATTLYDPVATNFDGRTNRLDAIDSFAVPIARLYAQYFGGDLTILPMEGYGTDVYIHLNKLTDDLEVK